jgi:hypothetical protein
LKGVSTSEQKVIENKANESAKEFNYVEGNLSHANNEGMYKVKKFQYTMEQWDTH